MKHLLLSKEDRLTVEVMRLRTDDKTAYMKFSVLVLLDEGLTLEQTATLLGISSGTVSNCKKKYSTDGLDKYLDRHYVPYAGRLSAAQLDELEVEVDQGMYADSKQVAEWIKERFDEVYAPNSVRAILKRLGFVHKKALQVPGNLNPEEQEEFLVELEALLHDARTDEEAIYFADGVHPQHNTRASYVWAKKGKEKEIRSNTGRRRVNITGAVNFCDPSDVEIVEADCVNGQTTQQLFQKLLDKHPDKERIYILVDNAKYNYNNELLDWLSGHPKILLVYLPTYSPNLNLVERLWKFMRKKVINLNYYEKFEDFRAAILEFFQNIKQYKTELESLITPNFQRFSVAPGA